MAERIDCPACGAPIEYEGQEGVIQCGFCGTDLRVVKETDETRFEVLAQPSPQKEVLSDKASEVVESTVEGGARFYDTEDEDANLFNFGGARQPGERRDEAQVAPGYASSGSMLADTDDFIPDERAATPETPVTIPGTPPYQAGRESAAIPGQSSNRRWLWIGLAVFVVACIMCACVAGVILAFFPAGVNFNF